MFLRFATSLRTPFAVNFSKGDCIDSALWDIRLHQGRVMIRPHAQQDLPYGARAWPEGKYLCIGPTTWECLMEE